ncbi:MAG: YjcZ family sporulation protein [Bacillus sp. (in: firmicutes)]
MTSPYSYETCDYGYSYPVAPVAGVGAGCYRGGFALIVVLFILLIIIGATCYSRC